MALLKAGYYQGAFYLAGYAVECALKACIAKQVRKFDFPDKKFANDVFTHDLKRLVSLAGLDTILASERSLNPTLDRYWSQVLDWNESFRYDPGITETQARSLCKACHGDRNSVLSWIRRRW